MWSVSTEIQVYQRSISVPCHPHERSSSPAGQRSMEHARVRTCSATTEEGRSTLRATEESNRASSSSPAQVEVRSRAVLPRRHCPEHQTTGPVPERADHSLDTCHSIGAGTTNPSLSRTPLRPKHLKRGRLFQHPRDYALIEDFGPHRRLSILILVENTNRRYITGSRITRPSGSSLSRKGSFAPIGPGTVPVETVKVIRPNHVSGLSRINVLQCRKRCTGQQKGSPFSPFRIV